MWFIQCNMHGRHREGNYFGQRWPLVPEFSTLMLCFVTNNLPKGFRKSSLAACSQCCWMRLTISIGCNIYRLQHSQPQERPYDCRCTYLSLTPSPFQTWFPFRRLHRLIAILFWFFEAWFETEHRLEFAMATLVCPWRTMIEKSLKANKRLAYARYVQFATVTPSGKPSNRTIVFRYASMNINRAIILGCSSPSPLLYR